MTEVTRRLFAFVIALSIIAYLVFMLAGASIYARTQDEKRTVWIRDEITPDTHRLSGLITVPSSCTELYETVEMLSPLFYKIKFKTWEHPNTECLHEPVQKQFYEIVFAPAIGVHFIATLDDVPMPILVVPYIP